MSDSDIEKTTIYITIYDADSCLSKSAELTGFCSVDDAAKHYQSEWPIVKFDMPHLVMLAKSKGADRLVISQRELHQ